MNPPRSALSHILAFALAGAAFASACSNDDSAPQEAEAADESAKADGTVYPIGTYVITNSSADAARDFQRLVLLSDKTFYAWREDDERWEGTYKFTRSTTTTKKFLRFEIDGEIDVGRWTWTLAKGVLELTREGERDAQQMVAADDAWCGVSDHCDLQVLEVPDECEAGGWECLDAACAYKCGPIVEPPHCETLEGGTTAWVSSEGDVYCEVYCEGAVPECRNIGSHSEGWYTDEAQGCNGALIGWTTCAP